jgi:hypothetical protein
VRQLAEPRPGELLHHRRRCLAFAELGVDQGHRGGVGRMRGCGTQRRAEEGVELLVLATMSPHREHLGSVDGAGERVAGPLRQDAGLVGERFAVAEATLHDRPEGAELHRVGK